MSQLPDTKQILGQGINMGGGSGQDQEVKDIFSGVSGGGSTSTDLFGGSNSSKPPSNPDGDVFSFLNGAGGRGGASDPFGGSSAKSDPFGASANSDPFASTKSDPFA